MFVAAELPVNERDFSGMVFVEYAVIENQVTIGADHNFLFALLPNLIGFDPISFQVARGGIVTESLAVLGEVCECVIGLANQEELAVVVPVDEAAHGSVSLRISVFWRYCVSPKV